jgi:hypothetical protein
MLDTIVSNRLQLTVVIFKDHCVNFLMANLSRKLAFAGTSAALAWLIGFYFALLPAKVPWLPSVITSGNLEWVSMIVAFAAGIWSLRLLFEAVRYRGVAWWAYAIGILTTAVTSFFAVIILYGLLH